MGGLARTGIFGAPLLESQPCPRMRRAASAARHLLQSVAVVLSCFLPLLPLLLLFFAIIFPPLAIAGSLVSGDDIGLPPAWHRWRRLPLLVRLPFVLFVHLPIGMYWLLGFIVEGFLLKPAALLAYELLARGPPRTTEPCESDVESNEPSSRRPAPASEDGGRYREHDSVWAALEGDGDNIIRGDVRLLSLSWLMGLADQNGVLPRRQELPEEAFLDAARLKRIEAGDAAQPSPVCGASVRNLL